MSGGVGFGHTPTYAFFFPCGGLFQQPARRDHGRINPERRAVRRYSMSAQSAGAVLLFVAIDVFSFLFYLALLGYSLVARLARGRNVR